MKNVSCVYDLVIIIYAIMWRYSLALSTAVMYGLKKNGITETVKQGFYLFGFFFNLKKKSRLFFLSYISFSYIFFSRLETFPAASDVVNKF